MSLLARGAACRAARPVQLGRCGAGSVVSRKSRTTITIMCWIAGGSTNRNSFKNIGCRLPAEPTRSTAAPRHLLGRHQGAPTIAKGCRLFVVLHPHGHSRLRACLNSVRRRPCSPAASANVRLVVNYLKSFFALIFSRRLSTRAGGHAPAVGGAPLGHSPTPGWTRPCRRAISSQEVENTY